jgi:putative ABC transport system substrate-binding protein
MKGFDMKRMARLAVLIASLAALASEAQSTGKVARIGFLRSVSASAFGFAPAFEAFRQGLRDFGYVEGQNLFIEWRWAEGKMDRLPDLSAELVCLKVDVIVTHGSPVTLAAKRATATIPIVMAWSADPVGAGLVASLAHPGGNLTGSSYMGPEVVVKRLDLLKVVPRIGRVAVLFRPDVSAVGVGLSAMLNAMEVAARTVRVALHPVGVEGPEELEGAFSTMTRRRVDGLVVFEGPMIVSNARRVAELAVDKRLPSVGFTEWPEAGGLLAYDPDIRSMARRAAVFVDKILKGAKPADLPVEQPTKFDLVINLKTAKALGLTIAPAVLARADQVIE